jgi:hypothetical protein
MNWWSEDIIGGDGPHAIYHNVLVDICNINLNQFDTEMNGDIINVRDVLESHMPQIIQQCLDYDPDVVDYSPIVALQVVGQMWISAGCRMNDPLKKAFISAALHDPVSDISADPSERAIKITSFINRLSNYPISNDLPLIDVDLDRIFL